MDATSTSRSQRSFAPIAWLRARGRAPRLRQRWSAAGIRPREVATGGGSDANALVARGFECVLLANGTEANHTQQESVAAVRLTEMLAVCETIVELVADEALG